MKKNTMKRNISAINKISKKMPKTINEAIDFNEEPYSNENLLIDDEEDIETPEVGGEEDFSSVKKLINEIKNKKHIC